MPAISKARRAARLNAAKARRRHNRQLRSSARACVCGSLSTLKNLARHKATRLHTRRMISKTHEDIKADTHSAFYEHPTLGRFKPSQQQQQPRTWEQRCAGQWICSYCGNLQAATALFDVHAEVCAVLQQKQFLKQQRGLRRTNPYTTLSDVGMPLPCSVPFQRWYRYSCTNDICALVVAACGNDIILVDDTANWMRVRANPVTREADNYDYCIFRFGSESELPAVEPGDVLQIHNVRFPPQAWTDEIVVTSTKATTWAAFRLDGGKVARSRSCREETQADLDKLEAVARWSDGFLCSWGLAAEGRAAMKSFCTLFQSVGQELGIKDCAWRAIKTAFNYTPRKSLPT